MNPLCNLNPDSDDVNERGAIEKKKKKCLGKTVEKSKRDDKIEYQT